jgi:aspartyl-tRNA(Asn)/glutamyl-tRNA(Gln) amidotransferase subunit C
MSISIDEVRHVARLARLSLDESEMMSLQSELNALLGHFADIQNIDVSGIDPASHAVNMHSVWSEDVPGNCLPREDALKNAPVSKAGLFVVPTILEG